MKKAYQNPDTEITPCLTRMLGHTFRMKAMWYKNMLVYVQKILLDLLSNWTNSLKANPIVLTKGNRICSDCTPRPLSVESVEPELHAQHFLQRPS